MTQPAPGRYYPVVGLVHTLALLTTLVAVAPASPVAVEDFAPRTDTLNIRFEAYSQNISLYHIGRGPFVNDDDWGGMTIFGLEAEWRRLRLGLAWYEDVPGTNSAGFLPVRLGYTIWRRPVGYVWKLQGMVPEVYGRFTAYLAPMEPEQPSIETLRVAGRAEIVAAVDMLGVGMDVSVGALAVSAKTAYEGHGIWRDASRLTPTVDVRFRLLTLSAAFPRRR